MKNKLLFFCSVILIISGAMLKVLIKPAISPILLSAGALGFLIWLYLTIKKK
jgi:hypothetical protein